MTTNSATKPNDKSDEQKWKEDLWKSSWRDLVDMWLTIDDKAKLDMVLQKFATELEMVRSAPPKSKYSAQHAIYLSVGIFVAAMIGLLLAPIDEGAITNLFQGFFAKEAGADKIQFALIMSGSGGIIPGIAYVILRDVEKERRNEELEAISLNLRHLRSKILSLKEDEAAQDLRRRQSA